MKTEDMPLFAQLLAQHGIDPTRVPQTGRFEVVQDERGTGVILDTVAPDPDDPYGLVDAHGNEVVYAKFYPEPEESR